MTSKGGGQIVVLRHRLFGDFNNALGLAEAISNKLNTPLTIRDIRLRSNALLPLLRLIIRRLRDRRDTALTEPAMNILFRDGDGLGLPRGALCVVSTLGAGEAPNAFLSAATGTAGIHLGRPKRMPPGFFDLVIAHQGEDAAEDELELPISPSRLRLEWFAPAAKRNGILLAIGGDAKGIIYPHEFWTALLTRVTDMARSDERRLSVSTSPRSGSTVESTISAHFQEAGVTPHQLILYGRGDRTALKEPLMNAGCAVVTAESVSMISDAIASGARVAAAYWRHLPDSPRISGFLYRQQKANRLALWDVAKTKRPDFERVVPLDECWSDVLWKAAEPVISVPLRHI